MFNQELFDNNFNFAFKAMAVKNMEIATKGLNQFFYDNKQFFTLDKKATVYGHLLTYAVEQQFSNSSYNPIAPYNVNMKTVNKCKHKAVFLETEDYIVNIGRSLKPNRLPSAAKYKVELAKNNMDENNQYELNLSEENNIIVAQPKKYALISYLYHNNDIKHLWIVVPNNEYKSIIHYADLKEHYQEYTNYIPEEEVEEQIVGLKKDLENKVKQII